VISSHVWELLIILVLILGNGFFAAAEIAIIASRKGRLQQQANDGNRGARLALELARDPDRFLPTVQVGISVVSAFATTIGGASLVEDLSASLSELPLFGGYSDGIALSLVALGIAVASLILGELVPKRIALRQAETLARYVAPFMSLLSRIARPAIWVLGLATNAVLWMFRITGKADSSVSLDDIEHLIDTGTAEGVLEQVEQKVAREALRLGERTVRDIMRPRIDLDALDVDTPPDEVIGSFAMAGFSRLPIYEGDLDHIIGFVHIKDLFRQQYLGWPIQLRKLLHPALFVPETMPLDRLLQLFQEKHNQLSVVLDEYGGTEGMVTLEDVIEELVGEIRDEHRRDDAQDFIERDDSSWLIDGGVSVADMIKRLEVRVADGNEARGFSTVSGLILDQLGRIPSIGDKAEWNDLALEVVDMDGQRIDRILVTRKSAEPEAAG